MRKVLPIAYPTLTLFPAYASTGAILEAHCNTDDWRFSQYIQLFIYNEKRRTKEERAIRGAFFSDYDVRKYSNLWQAHAFIENKWCPFLSVNNLITEIALRPGESFIDLIRRCVNQGYYLFLRLYYDPIETFFVPRKNYKHETFIYGYDDSKGKVSIGDYHFKGSGKYQLGECSYAEINAAFKLTLKEYKPFTHEIALIRFEDHAKYKLNYEHIVEQVFQYLRPDEKIKEDYTAYIAETINIREPVVYVGNEVFDCLIEFMTDEIALGKRKIDFRLFHGLYEHKLMMIKRLAFLRKEAYLGADKQAQIELYQKIVDNALIVRNKVIIFNSNGRYELLQGVQKTLKIMKEQESDILSDIFNA